MILGAAGVMITPPRPASAPPAGTVNRTHATSSDRNQIPINFEEPVIHLHPVRGIKPPPIPKKKRAIITPEQFDQLYQAIGSDTMKLLVEADVESGMRWGELAELRPRDLNFTTGVVTVSRVAVELSRRFHPEGGRFLIKDYPKDGEHRQFKLSPQIVRKIEAHIAARGIGADDLIFTLPQLPPPPGGGTSTAPLAGTRSASAAASTAAVCTPATGRDAGPPGRISHAGAGRSRPTGTYPAGGSAPMSGCPPWRPRTGRSRGRCTGYGTHTPRGCWPGEPTSTSSKSGLVTPASSPLRSTSAPSTRSTRPRSMP